MKRKSFLQAIAKWLAGTNYTNDKFVKNDEDEKVAKPIVLLRNRVEELSAYAVYRTALRKSVVDVVTVNFFST